MNLYSKLSPAGNVTSANHRWFESVYILADNATPLFVSQFPRAEIDPTRKMFSPKTVVSISLKVMATLVAMHAVGLVVVEVDVDVPAEVEVVLVDVGRPVAEVSPVGKMVEVAADNGPVAEVAKHWAGTLEAVVSPHDSGITPFLACTAETNAAKDQVKSTAERGVPSFRENCSARPPSEGVYFSITLMKPSAYVFTALMIVVNVDEELAYVPVAIEESRSWKKAKEVDVTVIDPICCHWDIASYSCSAAAAVLIYHGLPPM